MAETFLAVLLGMAIGGAIAWWAHVIRDLLVRLLNKKDRPESGVARPLPPAMQPPKPTVLSATSGVVRPPSPKAVARENAEERAKG